MPPMQQPSKQFPAINATLRHIESLAAQFGREASDIQLIAVTKTQPPSVLAALAAEGVVHFGENRLDHLSEMIHAAPQEAVFHYIGRIQRRQYAKVLAHCDCLHSFAEPAHVTTLVKACEARRKACDQARIAFRPVSIFCQVNIGIESHKAGVTPHHIAALLDALRQHTDVLMPVGLMTMAPDMKLPEFSRETVHSCFGALRELAEQHGLTRLSMGMSGDYDIAIAEGATDIRIGSALFRSA